MWRKLKSNKYYNTIIISLLGNWETVMLKTSSTWDLVKNQPTMLSAVALKFTVRLLALSGLNYHPTSPFSFVERDRRLSVTKIAHPVHFSPASPRTRIFTSADGAYTGFFVWSRNWMLRVGRAINNYGFFNTNMHYGMSGYRRNCLIGPSAGNKRVGVAGTAISPR